MKKLKTKKKITSRNEINMKDINILIFETQKWLVKFEQNEKT